MRKASAEFYNALKNDNRDYLERVTITLADSTVLNITNENIWQNGLSFEDSVSTQGMFQNGAVIINKANFVLNNIYNTYDAYDFVGATVVIELGLMIDNEPEYVKIGTYTIVDEPEYNGSFIKIECLDNMYKFDKLFSTDLTFPNRCDNVVLDACAKCGVTCGTIHYISHFSTYHVAEPPKDVKTFREVLSYTVQIACFDYARCNADGELIMGYFGDEDLETPSPSGSSYKGRLIEHERALLKTYPPYAPYYDGAVTINGLTFTPDYENGTITINGTSTTRTTYNITSPNTYSDMQRGTLDYYMFKSGKYRISGCPADSSTSNYYMHYTRGNISTYVTKNGEEFTLKNDRPYVYGLCIEVIGGKTLNNVVFAPKIERIDGGIPEYLDVDYMEELFNYNISKNEIEITGARVYGDFNDDNGVAYQYDTFYGTSGYTVSIENNVLLRDSTDSSYYDGLAQVLFAYHNDLRFRIAEITHSSNPLIEAGDLAVVIDRKDNRYPILVSSTRFSIGSAQKTFSYAEPNTTNSQNRPSAYATADNMSLKVNRTGDTMSGDLSIKKDSSPMYKQECSVSGRIDAESLSAAISLGAFHRYDSNDEPVFYSETFRTQTNILYTSFIQRRYSADGSTSTNHGFYLRNLNDGTLDVTFPSNASREAWLSGLGVNNAITVKTASSVSVASGTAWADGTTILNSGSLGAGTYVIRGYVSFASNATGRRFTALMTSNTGTSVYNSMVDSRTAINGAATHCNIFGIVTLTAATTLYLRVTQNSGTTLSCSGRLEVLKIH